jgi:hypothetical protein
LKPGICAIPAKQDGTSKVPNWELDKDPFIDKPFRNSGAWDPDESHWSGVDGNDASQCLAGAADVVMERAFRYGFCDYDKYNVETKLTVTDQTFGLQKADYYIVNIVVWKGDPIKTVQVSKVSGFKATDHLPSSGSIVITSDPDNPCTYALSSQTLGDLIKSINADPKACAKASLVGQHISLSSTDGKSDIAVSGDTNQVGKWVNPLTYSVDSSAWYVFNHGDHGNLSRQHLSSFSNEYPYRIYGTKKPIGLVAIHVRPDGDSWELFQQLKVKYTVSVSKKTSTPVSDLQGLLGIILNPTAFGAVPKSDPDGFYGSTFFNAASPSDLTIAAEVDFPTWQQATGKPSTGNPQNKSGLLVGPVLGVQSTLKQRSVLSSIALRMRTEQPETSDSSSSWDGHSDYAADRDNVSPLTADGAATDVQASGGNGSVTKNPTKPATDKGTTTTPPKPTTDKATTQPAPTAPTVDCQPTIDASGQQSPCKFNSTFNDEDLTHWDVSFGVPFHTLTDLQYNQSSGSGSSVVPKTVTRLNAYGFFDIYPIATDIVTPPVIAWPHFKFGLPISGKVFNKPFFGMGDGLYIKQLSKIIPVQFSFYGGVVYNKEFRQIPGTVGSSNVQGHRVWSGSYGIEIPVKQFKTMLSNSSKSKSNNSSSNTSGQNASSTTQ